MKHSKETIFDVALELFSTSNFEVANMREIARLSGIKAGSIYSHFESKQAILDAIYLFYQDNIEQSFVCDQKISVDNYLFLLNNLQPNLSARMLAITKLIYIRNFADKKSQELLMLTNKLITNKIESILEKVNINYDQQLVAIIANSYFAKMFNLVADNPTIDLTDLIKHLINNYFVVTS